MKPDFQDEHTSEDDASSHPKKLFSTIPYSVVCVGLLLAVAVLTAFLILTVVNRNAEATAAAGREATLDDERALLDGKLATSRSQLAQAEKENEDLNAEVKRLEDEQEKLILDFENKDEQYRLLNARISELKEEIAQNEQKIQKLNEQIVLLGNIFSVDLNAQMSLLNHLTELLENPITYEETKPLLDENGEPILDEEGEPLTETVTMEPHIAVYYEDILNGYTYSYHAEDVFDSASLIKAPFSLAHLMAASEEVVQQEAARQAAEEEGIPYEPPHHTDENGEEVSDLIYAFDREFTYYRDKSYQYGSGRIVGGEDGTVYTYGELFRYLLRYSDNVAYHELKTAYGIDVFRALVLQQGWKSMYGSLSNMSARDGGKIMAQIYRFTESDAAYASLMKEAMTGSAHSVIIPAAVHSTTLHKYGWDQGAYHDMAIVYDAYPYVISIMTNYDAGGSEVNAYLREIVSTIDSIHRNFYVSQ